MRSLLSARHRPLLKAVSCLCPTGGPVAATTVLPLIRHPLPTWPEVRRVVGAWGPSTAREGTGSETEGAVHPTLWGWAAPTLGVFARDQPVCPEEAGAPWGGPPAPLWQPRPRGVQPWVRALSEPTWGQTSPYPATQTGTSASQPASSVVKRRKRIKLLQASTSETSCRWPAWRRAGDHGLYVGGAHEAGPAPQHGPAQPGGPGEWLLDAGRAPGGRVLGPHPPPLSHCSPSGQPSPSCPECPAGLFPTERPDTQGICWEWPELGPVGPALPGHCWAPTMGHLSFARGMQC